MSLTRLVIVAFVVVCAATSPTPFGVDAAAEGSSIGMGPATYDPDRPETESYFVLDAEPGAVVHDELRLRNPGDSEATVFLYPVDTTTGQTGGIVYLMKDDPRRSVGSWLATSEDEVTIEPGGERIIPFTLTVPSDIEPGEFVGGLVAENVEVAKGEESGALVVDVKSRTAVAVQVNIPGPRVEQLAITRLQPELEGGYQTLSVGLENQGNVMVSAEGMVSVQSADGAVQRDIPLSVGTMLPDTTIWYPLIVPGDPLPDGEYLGRVEVTYGEGRTATFESSFRINTANETVAYTPGSVAVTTSGGGTQVISSELVGILLTAIIATFGALGFVWMSRRGRQSRRA